MSLLEKTSRQRVIISTIILAVVPFLAVELFKSSLYQVETVPSYLVFHNVAEFFSIMVSCSIFGLGWYAYDQNRDSHSLFLSIAFLGITTDAQIYRVPCIGLLPGAHKIFCRKDTSRQNRSLLLG